MPLTNPEHVDAIVKEAEKEVQMTPAQKEALKQKTSDAITDYTEERIGDFKKHLLEELKIQAEDNTNGEKKDGKLEDSEVDEAVTSAAEKSKTPVATPPTPTEGENGGTTPTGTEGNDMAKTGSKKWNMQKMLATIFPSLKDIIESYWRDGYSFNEEDLFEGEDIDGKKMADVVKSLGVDVPESGKQRDKIGQYTVEHLAKLKIPADKGIDFLEYMGGMSRRTPPADLVTKFDAARDHYATLSDPKNIADIFNFSVEEKPVVTPPVETPTTPEAPTINNTIEIALDGGKTEKIEAKPEDITAFNSIKSSSETVLGTKESSVAEKLKTEYLAQKDNYDKAGDKKPEEAGKILKTVAEKSITAITTKIGETKLDEKDKKADFEPTKLHEYTLVGLQDTLKVYFPLAFDKVYARVEKAIDSKTNITEEAKKLLKESLIGYLREPGKTGASIFTAKTKDGYEKVVSDILKQEELLGKLNGTTDDYWKGIASSNTSPLSKIS